jgi:hypothetical protein
MRNQGRTQTSGRLAAVVAAALASLAATASGCGEKGEPDVESLPAQPPAASTAASDGGQPGDQGEPGGGGGGGGDAGRLTTPAREAAQTVEAYIDWIDSANGRALCTLLTEEAAEMLELPVRRGGCGASLSASIGYRDPRGAPVFEGVRLRGTNVNVNGSRARVRATVSTTFADRAQPSIEDDLVYLLRVGGEWRVAKPSTTLYRAIGSEPPLAAITPP